MAHSPSLQNYASLVWELRRSKFLRNQVYAESCNNKFLGFAPSPAKKFFNMEFDLMKNYYASDHNYRLLARESFLF
jgi:hypothetical protein